MAAGDVVFFDQWLVDAQKSLHDMDSDVLKLGIITTAATPAATSSDPRWGSDGTINYSTSEVTAGGNYPSGGPALSNNSVTLSGGAAVFDADDLSIDQNLSNPTNARWGIGYNDTDTGKRCCFYVDFGSDSDLRAKAFNLTWDAGGISSMNQS